MLACLTDSKHFNLWVYSYSQSAPCLHVSVMDVFSDIVFFRYFYISIMPLIFFFEKIKPKKKKFNTELIIIQLSIWHRRKEKWNTWLLTVVHKRTLLHKDIFQPHITSILQGYWKEHHIFFCWRYDIHHAISIIHETKQTKIKKIEHNLCLPRHSITD